MAVHRPGAGARGGGAGAGGGAVRSGAFSEDSSGGSDGGALLFADNILMAVVYLLLALWCIRVLRGLLCPRCCSPARQKQQERRPLLPQPPSSLSPASRGPNLHPSTFLQSASRFSGGSTAEPLTSAVGCGTAPAGDSETADLSSALFHALVLTVSLARSVTWALSTSLEIADKGYLQLAVLVVPSLLYLSSLFVVVSMWCHVRDVLVDKFGAHAAALQQGQRGSLHSSLIGSCAAMWIGLVALTAVEISTGEITHGDSVGTRLVLWYMSMLFTLVGVLFLAFGVALWRRLGAVPMRLSCAVAARTRRARAQVRCVTALVAPSCIIRALLTLLQLESSVSPFTGSLYFPTLFYIALEVMPIAVMLGQLRGAEGRCADTQREPEGPRPQEVPSSKGDGTVPDPWLLPEPPLLAARPAPGSPARQHGGGGRVSSPPLIVAVRRHSSPGPMPPPPDLAGGAECASPRGSGGASPQGGRSAVLVSPRSAMRACRHPSPGSGAASPPSAARAQGVLAQSAAVVLSPASSRPEAAAAGRAGEAPQRRTLPRSALGVLGAGTLRDAAQSPQVVPRAAAQQPAADAAGWTADAAPTSDAPFLFPP
eukprot:TRINITY_DN6341_c0_g1_i1.p1 TRINITY_DN6341_c0_g1~~TRINITY_DN6341_c0_g1_i1.p1  ORF type:complete len:628 (+),score=163.84 TRINITY_DN6341_c0_g1_i1:96-1886(+)